MKKLVIAGFGLLIFSMPTDMQAQEKDRSVPGKIGHGVKEGAKGVKKGVKKGAHEVAEQTVEMKSDIEDKEVENKQGPQGQDIFLEDDGRYYYVDGKGHKVFLSESELKNKPPKKDD